MKKYRLCQFIEKLQQHLQHVDAIKLLVAETGIPRCTLYRHSQITLDDSRSIAEETLQKYAWFFSRHFGKKMRMEDIRTQLLKITA